MQDSCAAPLRCQGEQLKTSREASTENRADARDDGYEDREQLSAVPSASVMSRPSLRCLQWTRCPNWLNWR